MNYFKNKGKLIALKNTQKNTNIIIGLDWKTQKINKFQNVKEKNRQNGKY